MAFKFNGNLIIAGWYEPDFNGHLIVAGTIFCTPPVE